MLSHYANHWLVFASIAPASWAVGCLLDILFIERRLYKSPRDGAIISGLFALVPAMLFLHAPADPNPDGNLLHVLAPIGAGICYYIHLNYYFKSLFGFNDAANAEIFNTLSIFLVPVLALILLGEALTFRTYVGITIAMLAIALLVRRDVGNIGTETLRYLIFSVISISFAMVLQAFALRKVDYASAVTLFSLATFSAAFVTMLMKSTRTRRILGLFRRYFGLFCLAEALGIVALLASQRATDLSPSVSLVVVVECALPVLLMLFSGVALFFVRRHSPNAAAVINALSRQTRQSPLKLAALGMIILAISVVQLEA